MALKLSDIKKLAAEAAKTAPDLTAPPTGGDYKPPEAGNTRLRYVGYIEYGVHSTTWQGQTKTKPRSRHIFELSGPKHEPRKADDGRVFPSTIEIREPIGFTKKNGYLKLFNALKAEHPNVTTFGELIGEPFRGVVVHEKAKTGDKVYANLKGENGYTISGVTYEDPESGEVRSVKVAEPISPLRFFLWNSPSLEQWDSLFIDGTWDNGDSRNKYQEEIKSAENFEGSPIWDLLTEAGREAELVPAAKGTPRADESADNDEDAPAQTKVEEKAAAAALNKASKAPAKPVAASKPAGKGKVAPKVEEASTADPEDDPLAGLDD